ncbi:B3 domain-containing transcription factor VRN1-like [Punica granatum]|uniref:B3 domain-containing transcription factor VRN1-like n=2 Tax=Punica granatum TaxID=22663 RepID=A0A6P8DQC3_PUNGR|nr:B3 domain-containing transcription factor VRN1-like [Punica granatum]
MNSTEFSFMQQETESSHWFGADCPYVCDLCMYVRCPETESSSILKPTTRTVLQMSIGSIPYPSPMASAHTHRGRRAVKLQDGFFKSPTPRFFKVMVRELLHRGRIMIPRKFIWKYGDVLSELVLLRDPSGESFEVQVEEAEGKVWLGKGWREFEEHYPIEEGSFLVFELEGNNLFHVLILGMCATEIDYPTVNRSQDPQLEPSDEYLPSETEETSDDDSPVKSTDASNSEPEQKRSRCGQPFQHSKPSKLPTEDSDDSSTYSPSVQSESESESERLGSTKRSTTRLRKEAKQGPSSHLAAGGSGIKKRTIGLQKRVKLGHSSRRAAGCRRPYVNLPLPPSSHKALEAAKRFQTKFPAFCIQLRPTYTRSGGVSICSSFMKRNNFKPTKGPVYLNLKHRGRSWRVKMFCYTKEHRGKLCGGWGAFIEENSLQNGDVCVFELVETNIFRVHFFRCSTYA